MGSKRTCFYAHPHSSLLFPPLPPGSDDGRVFEVLPETFNSCEDVKYVDFKSGASSCMKRFRYLLISYVSTSDPTRCGVDTRGQGCTRRDL